MRAYIIRYFPLTPGEFSPNPRDAFRSCSAAGALARRNAQPRRHDAAEGLRLGEREHDDPRLARRLISSKMLGGASQIMSMIRVKCNGT